MKFKENPTCLSAVLLWAILSVASIGCLAEPLPYVNIKTLAEHSPARWQEEYQRAR